MTKEIEFHDNGEVTVVLGETYHLPRPTFGQKKQVGKAIAEIGDKINALSEEITAKTQELIAESGGDDEDAVDTERFLEVMGSLDVAVFSLLFDTWKNVVATLSGKPVELDLDDAPLWVAHTDLLHEMMEHWQTNPLASTQSPPSLTVVK